MRSMLAMCHIRHFFNSVVVHFSKNAKPNWATNIPCPSKHGTRIKDEVFTIQKGEQSSPATFRHHTCATAIFRPGHVLVTFALQDSTRGLHSGGTCHPLLGVGKKTHVSRRQPNHTLMQLALPATGLTHGNEDIHFDPT